MNGATAEPCASTSSPPKRTSTRMMGPSHHFLRSRRNAQISAGTDGCAGRAIGRVLQFLRVCLVGAPVKTRTTCRSAGSRSLPRFLAVGPALPERDALDGPLVGVLPWRDALRSE